MGDEVKTFVGQVKLGFDTFGVVVCNVVGKSFRLDLVLAFKSDGSFDRVFELSARFRARRSFRAAASPLAETDNSRPVWSQNFLTKWLISSGMSSARSRSGGKMDRYHRDRGKKGPRETSRRRPSVFRSRLVAAITRASIGISSWAPTGRTRRSCNTRSSLTCIAGDISPISSKKIVPLFGASKRPLRLAFAPVNEPFYVAKQALIPAASR